MAIYTRFGTPVEITAVDFQADETWVTVKSVLPHTEGKTREVALHDLRADGGLKEIMEDIYAKFPQHDPHSSEYKA